MPKYVTSLHRNARLAHLGSNRLTACGHVFVGPFEATDDAPADRLVCVRCVDAALAQKTITAAEAAAMMQHRATAARRVPADAVLDAAIALFKEGLNDRQVALRLGISLRSLIRRTQQGMRAVDATTRFQWGYRLGAAEGW